jgi:5,10-methylene-tetrahydrofolate dehydrogenase/methenyl tetrahydrofolate cyclohydrolase
MRKKKWARALALGAATLHFFPSLNYSLRNRAVVITGSSRGLGLALAEEFLRYGARVALLATPTSLTARRNCFSNASPGRSSP